MTELIETCQSMSEDALDIAERLEEVDGDLEELDPEERQAISLLAQSVDALFSSLDPSDASETESTTDKQSGRAFY